jgi:hypothetical protein
MLSRETVPTQFGGCRLRLGARQAFTKRSFCIFFDPQENKKMRVRSIVVISLATLALIISAIGYAQVKRPFHDGSVWDIAFIRVKPGMDVGYMNYLAGDWKRNQEAFKKAGMILSYKVISTESHGPGDFNLMLMTEYKDLATMEANQDKGDTLSQQVIGDDQKQMQGYRDRSEMRENMGSRLSREVILEPK